MGTSQQSDRSPFQPHDWPISQLPGLTYDNQSKLAECGIKTTLALIQTANNPETKMMLANQLQIHIQYINKWVALAELARIPSVGCQYCGLLLHAGVSSTILLAQIPVHRLHQQILRLQVGTMQRRDLCPSVDRVQEWINQARSLTKLESRR